MQVLRNRSIGSNVERRGRDSSGPAQRTEGGVSSVPPLTPRSAWMRPLHLGGPTMQVLKRPPSGWPALVLNADYRPLSYYPLSLWPWQEVIKAVFLDRVDVIATYDQVVHSPSFEMKLPSVVSLKHYVTQDRPPAFTRFNLFLRDSFTCQYCHAGEDLTFDHVIPRSRGGRTTW